MIIVIGYSLGCAAFLALAGLILINRPQRAMGLSMLALCLGTALWAALAAIQVWWMPGVAHAVEDLRSWLWLDLLFLALAGPLAHGRGASLIRFGLAGLMACAAAIDLSHVTDTASPIDFSRIQEYSRIVVAIVGLLLVENVFRNGKTGQRWRLTPLCVAAGALFGFDFYVFADAIVQHGVDVSLLAVRGILLMLIAPLLLLAMVRNQDWNIQVHVSRNIVFHTATLTIGGLFLIVTGTAASLLGRIAGPWGDVFKTSFLVTAFIGFVVLLSVARLRSRMWRFINENFFSRRYDYRLEWMRFVDTVSSSSDDSPLQARVIRALADVVDSHGGVLWLEDFDGKYRPARMLHMKVSNGHSEAADGDFVSAFRGGETIQEFQTAQLKSAETTGQPVWALPGFPVWLAVPLMQKDHLLGFIALAPSRAPQQLHWESFDLLRTIGRQAASYLAEERVTSAYADARALIEYSKNFGFIAHDVKNISGQLTMLVANIEKFGDDRQFRADMIKTLRHAVTKLSGLLNVVTHDGEPVAAIDPVPVVKSVALAAAQGGRDVVLDLGEEPVRVKIRAADLESAVTHLVTNALEVSLPGDPVTLRLRTENENATIAVEDRGQGMNEAFIRDVLFTPRKSTKAHGHGMGAYQAREIVRAAGGNLNVASAPGKGTVMQIVLPSAFPAKPRTEAYPTL